MKEMTRTQTTRLQRSNCSAGSLRADPTSFARAVVGVNLYQTQYATPSGSDKASEWSHLLQELWTSDTVLWCLTAHGDRNRGPHGSDLTADGRGAGGDQERPSALCGGSELNFESLLRPRFRLGPQNYAIGLFTDDSRPECESCRGRMRWWA